MIGEYDYNVAASMYSKGLLTYKELLEVIMGYVTIEQIEKERLWV